MDGPSFEGFHSQLDFKLTYDNKSQIIKVKHSQHSCSIYSFVLKSIAKLA